MTRRSRSILGVSAVAILFGTLSCTPTRSSTRVDRAGGPTPELRGIRGEPQPFAEPHMEAESATNGPDVEPDRDALASPSEPSRASKGASSGLRGGERAKSSGDTGPVATRPSTRERSSSVARPMPPRPGLGTAWGQNRTSYVQSTSFERADRRPDDLLSIFYNDAEGVEAASGRSLWELSSNRSEGLDGMLSVEILDMAGRAYPGTRVQGRDFVVGRDGEYYAIRLRNHGSERFEVVASVDGLDVLDGNPASTEKRGYLLPSFGSLEIDGFRRSTTTVAGFRFGSVAESYAERKGHGRNVGVIGIAVFREHRPEPIWDEQELWRRERAQPFPRGYAQPPRPRDYD